VKVLERYNRPMKVTEILIGLEQDGYQWTAKNPKQTLYVRIGKLAGVKKAGDGLYVAEAVAGAAFGIIPRRWPRFRARRILTNPGIRSRGSQYERPDLRTEPRPPFPGGGGTVGRQARLCDPSIRRVVSFRLLSRMA